MKDLTVAIKFDSCRYQVAWPDFFLECSITTAKQLLRWLDQYDYLNEESVRIVDEGMPDLIKLAHGHIDKAIKELKAREEMEQRQLWKWEDQQDLHKYYQNKARFLRQMPQRAEKLQAYWKELRT